MAVNPLIPASNFSFVMPSDGVLVVKTPAVADLTGAPLSMAGATSVALNLTAPSPSGGVGVQIVQTPAITITGNADGTFTLELDPSLITAIAPGGTLNAAIYGIVSPGTASQLLAFGQIKAALY